VVEVATPAPEPAPSVSQTVTGSKEDWMTQAGIPQSEWTYVDYIISHESHWCPTVWNGEVGCPTYHGTNRYKAYGLCQALEPSKMASAGDDWATNPITQLKWCHGYAISRYGSWANAKVFWINNRYW